MANIYSLKSGLSTDPTVWSGGVVPVSGDRVLISAGHVVTLAASHTWGDDTTSTITINGVSTAEAISVRGTLKASRTVGTTLTCRGDLIVRGGGKLDYGTEADPVPAAVKATLVANYSTSPAHNKFGILTDTNESWSGISFWGADKTPKTTMATASATDTVILVDDATGWEVGDLLTIGLSVAEASVNGVRYRDIVAISDKSITLSSALGFASQAGRTVVNTTRNVRVVGHMGTLYRTHVSIRVASSFTSVEAIEIGPSEFVTGGNSANTWQFGCLNLHWNATATVTKAVKRIYRPVVHTLASSSANIAATNALFNFYGNQAYTYQVEEPIGVSSAGTTWGLLYSGTSTNIVAPVALRMSRFVTTAYSQGAVGAVIDGGFAEAMTGDLLSGNAVALTFNGTTFNGATRFSSSGLTAFGALEFNACDIGGAMGFYAPDVLYSAVGGYAPAVFNDCTVHPSLVVKRSAGLSAFRTETALNFRNKNNDITLQEIFRQGGRLVRDNATTRRGQSSLAMYPWYAGVALTHSHKVRIASLGTTRIKGALRFNAEYGTATPPKVTVSGMGITPVTYTAPAAADEWHEFDLSVTSAKTYPGEVTVTYTAQSASNTESATCWVDGVAMTDMVPWARHYGHAYTPSVAALTPDSVVQLSESEAAALTGISFTDGTLTVSEPRSIREIYDWMQWYECSNQLEPILASTDGTTFAIGAHLTITGSLTGSGTITLAAGKVYSNSGSTSLIIQSDAGRIVPVVAPALIAGSRVQLYNHSTAQELYNDVLAIDGLSVVGIYTSPQIVRLRAEHFAKLPLETVGVLSSSGLTFLDVQQEDNTYLDNGIDGDLVTEFAADGVSLQVDVSDPDGVTSVQRLYAWMQHYQTTAEGIASSFFGAMVAQDGANYIIDQALANIQLDNVSGLPVRVVGGYLSRKDGSTIIADTSGSIQMDPGKAYVTGGVTPAAVAAAVRTELALDLSRLARLAKLSAIDATLVVTPTSRVAGDVSQTIEEVDGTVTVTTL